MAKLPKIDKELLSQIADLHGTPQGSFNIRKNGESIERVSNDDIQIISKKDKSGIDIIVKEGLKNKSVHIPVILTIGNFSDVVYNDFYIGKNADVLIVAGCGIHNAGAEKSQHDGIHAFHIEEGAKVKYIEKHLGVGNGSGDKVLNPTTKVFMKKDSFFEMETIQLGGVSFADRKTSAVLGENSKLVIKEKILTDKTQSAKTFFDVKLKGKNSSVEVVSRSVAKDSSTQKFVSKVFGQNECFGHVECDGIIVDNAKIESSPQIVCEDINASLVHEAAIGKIAGEQITKLQTLGLTKEEAENEIIKGFLN